MVRPTLCPFGGLFQLIFAVWMSTYAIQSSATTLRQVSTDEMLANSELVFHGRVLERWAQPGTVGDAIHTYVRFEVTDIIKGNYDADTLALRFLGGTYNGITMKVSDQIIPQTGEEGVYFVASLEQHQINPFYGWFQGHFVVKHTKERFGVASAQR